MFPWSKKGDSEEKKITQTSDNTTTSYQQITVTTHTSNYRTVSTVESSTNGSIRKYGAQPMRSAMLTNMPNFKQQLGNIDSQIKFNNDPLPYRTGSLSKYPFTSQESPSTSTFVPYRSGSISRPELKTQPAIKNAFANSDSIVKYNPKPTTNLNKGPILSSYQTGPTSRPSQGTIKSFAVPPTYPSIKSLQEKLKIKVVKSKKRHDVNRIVPTYSTSGNNRGRVILINNVMFNKDAKSLRKGAEVDEQNVISVFRKMGFVVEAYKNLTKQEMENKLRNYSQKRELKYIDINVVVMMSHGHGTTEGSTKISGTDNKLLSTSDIIDNFDSDKCPNLINKPKIFIFQCCRGDQFQNIESDAVPFQVVQKKQSDILIAYSTVPGYVSHRNPILGTWYIQALCKVFMEYAHEIDVEGLLKIVEGMLNSLSHGSGYTQTSSYENRGFKTCYLHPI